MLPVLGAQAMRPTLLAPMTIVGLDPSVAAYGWAVVALDEMRPRVIDAGCIVTERDEAASYRYQDDADRIDAIARALFGVFALAQTRGPLCVAMEVPGGSKSSQAVKMLSYAFATTRTACIARGVRPIELRADEVKRVIGGGRDAEKHRVADGVHRLTGWRSNAKTEREIEGESDAVAVALAGARRNAR